MEIKTIPPDTGSSSGGAILADGTVPLTGVWDTGNVLIKGPSAIYTSSTAPLSPYTGMLWNDTSIATRKMIRSWNGSSWDAIYGYETADRTISLVHDHGKLLTAADFVSTWNDIGKNGAAAITIEIDNKTYKTFAAVSAIDAGSGNVMLPLASGHGFVAGEKVCIDGTKNYDGVFDIVSVEEGYIIIPARYVAEKIPADAVVRVVIENAIYFKVNTNSIEVTAKGYISETRTKKQRVVIYNTSTTTHPYFGYILGQTKVNGIRVYTLNSIGFQATTCNDILFESCSVTGSMSSAGIYFMSGASGRVLYPTIENVNRGISTVHGATVVSFEGQTMSNVNYGLYAYWGGTIIKASTQQPTGSTANEFTSYGGLIR